MKDPVHFRILNTGEPMKEGDRCYISNHNSWFPVRKKSYGQIWSPDIAPVQRQFKLPKGRKPKDIDPKPAKSSYDFRKKRKECDILITFQGDIHKAHFDPNMFSPSKDWVCLNIDRIGERWVKTDDLETARMLEVL